jgi:hypothetical protein
MNWNYRDQLPVDFAPDSRVWLYQASRVFSAPEAIQVENLLKQFAGNWQSHGSPVKGYGHLFFGQFIVLMADEAATGVSGCSTDSSVRLIKQIEQTFTISMFDRQALAFAINDSVQLIPLSQVQQALESDTLTPGTIYFNNLVQTKEELGTKWMIPLKESWLAKRLALNA